MATRFMCALVILDAVEQEVLPGLGTSAPEMVWDPTAALMRRIEGGETADGICAIDDAIDRLVAQGRLDPASVRPLVQAEVGIAVRRDMETPPPETGDDLRALLLGVPSIVYSRAGASGIYFETLIDRLGIGAEVRAKSLVIPAGLTGEKVRDGSAALAVQQMSELRAVDGIRIVGALPPGWQQNTDFSAAVFADAADRAGAEAFIAALTTPRARDAYLSRGLAVRF